MCNCNTYTRKTEITTTSGHKVFVSNETFQRLYPETDARAQLRDINMKFKEHYQELTNLVKATSAIADHVNEKIRPCQYPCETEKCCLKTCLQLHEKEPLNCSPCVDEFVKCFRDFSTKATENLANEPD